MNGKDRLVKARTTLIMDHPFWGILSMRLELIEATWAETAMTDGQRLYYSAEFLETLTNPQVLGLLAHEISHCANGHLWRGGERDHDRWNIACDYTINDILKSCGFELPKGALFDTQYKDLAAEEIYSRLPKNPLGSKGGMGKGTGGKGKNQSNSKGSANSNQNGSDPGSCGGIIQTKMSQEKANELKAEWKAAIAQAVQIAKGRGDIPADMLLQIQEVLNPPLPWYVLLRDFVEKSARNDYNWTRPNRRYIQNGIVLPTLLSEELPEICVAIDTSGSTIPYMSHFANELSGVLQAYRTTARVIYCDAKVHKEEVWTTEDLPLKIQPVGGGGTSAIPVFDHIQEHGLMPSCLVFLTDLESCFPEKEPDYPVMWITPNDLKGPWGMTVKINMKDYKE